MAVPTSPVASRHCHEVDPSAAADPTVRTEPPQALAATPLETSMQVAPDDDPQLTIAVYDP